MKTPTADELRQHLAYEVHYLVLAACRFPSVEGRDAALYQDSALLHGRNLLEFSKPLTRPSNGWWVSDLGGDPPQPDSAFTEWSNFINGNVTHLGGRRLKGLSWPVPKDDRRLIALAEFSLERIEALLPAAGGSAHVKVMSELVGLGLRYLGSQDESLIAEIARLVDEP